MFAIIKCRLNKLSFEPDKMWEEDGLILPGGSQLRDLRLIQNYVKSGQYLADIIPSQLKAELHVDCLSLITVLLQTGEGEQEQWS